MRSVVQRVINAEVLINNTNTRKIGKGLLVLLGIEDADTTEDVIWLSQKICNLRIFNNNAGIMDLSVRDIEGEIMLVSQFTLHASTRKGNRPSYIRASKPNVAIPMYNFAITELTKNLGKKITTGEFGADMKITLINDGPVTIIFDTKNKE